jgi:transposase
MWTSRNRCRYERKGLRYPTDLTDAERALVAPHIQAANRGGRPRTTNMREVTNAILYVLGTGCQWRALPKDFPPRTTVFEYLDLWEWDGTLGRLDHALFLATREQADKEASPTAAIIDSQSVKIVERTIAWLNRCPRLAKDSENLNRKALAFLCLASIRVMLRKLCNPA